MLSPFMGIGSEGHRARRNDQRRCAPRPRKFVGFRALRSYYEQAVKKPARGVDGAADGALRLGGDPMTLRRLPPSYASPASARVARGARGLRGPTSRRACCDCTAHRRATLRGARVAAPPGSPPRVVEDLRGWIQRAEGLRRAQRGAVIDLAWGIPQRFEGLRADDRLRVLSRESHGGDVPPYARRAGRGECRTSTTTLARRASRSTTCARATPRRRGTPARGRSGWLVDVALSPLDDAARVIRLDLHAGVLARAKVEVLRAPTWRKRRTRVTPSHLA